MTTTAQYVARRAHLCRLDRGLREHAAPHSHRNLLCLTFIVLRFPALTRFHRVGTAQAKGTAFLRTEVRQPIPPKQTCDANAEVFPLQRNQA